MNSIPEDFESSFKVNLKLNEYLFMLQSNLTPLSELIVTRQTRTYKIFYSKLYLI